MLRQQHKQQERERRTCRQLHGMCDALRQRRKQWVICIIEECAMAGARWALAVLVRVPVDEHCWLHCRLREPQHVVAFCVRQEAVICNYERVPREDARGTCPRGIAYANRDSCRAVSRYGAAALAPAGLVQNQRCSLQ